MIKQVDFESSPFHRMKRIGFGALASCRLQPNEAGSVSNAFGSVDLVHFQETVYSLWIVIGDARIVTWIVAPGTQSHSGALTTCSRLIRRSLAELEIGITTACPLDTYARAFGGAPSTVRHWTNVVLIRKMEILVHFGAATRHRFSDTLLNWIGRNSRLSKSAVQSSAGR